ncbi:MAG: transposase [Candidatus Tectomicrobia bacterium]|nr:transposase [Candidatus Tectomicrobia bacterium]
MVRRTSLFQLYRSKRLKHLHRQIDLAAEIYNHCIALQKRYYQRYGGYSGYYRLKRHVTKLKRLRRYAHWRQLGSQAIQDIVQRIDLGYQKFFRKENPRPPSFRKRHTYRSFTLTQAGWKYLGGNRLQIGASVYRFHRSRPLPKMIKTLTIKRLPTGRMMVCFSCLCEPEPVSRVMTGHSAGFDFGLQTVLTGSDGTRIQAPQPLKQRLRELRKASRSLSRKVKGSGHRRRARLHLARVHRRIANQRRAWHWQLARDLCQTYDVISLEDLDLRGMRRLWGQKSGDLGHGTFLRLLPGVAQRLGTELRWVDRWFPSSKLCSVCGTINHDLALRDRVWTCSCGITHDRDFNAATNIHREGASSRGRGGVRPVQLAATD